MERFFHNIRMNLDTCVRMCRFGFKRKITNMNLHQFWFPFDIMKNEIENNLQKIRNRIKLLFF